MKRSQALWKLRRKRMAKRAVAAAAAASVAATVAVGGAVAFFSDTDSVTNVVSVAERLDVAVEEPAWSLTDNDGDGVPDAAQNLVPGQAVPKDPRVANRAGVESWCMAQVGVPVREASLVGEDGRRRDPAPVELFSWELQGGWEEYGEPRLSADGTTVVHTYLAKDTVAVGTQTPPIFTQVTMADVLEGSVSGTCSIDIKGFGVQAHGFSSPSEAWEALCGLDVPEAPAES